MAGPKPGEPGKQSSQTGIPWWRRLRRRQAPPPQSPPTQELNEAGTIGAQTVRMPRPPTGRFRMTPPSSPLPIGAALLLILLLAFAFWQSRLPIAPVPADRFVVLVAPFADRDGRVSQTGRQIADDLINAINQELPGVQARATGFDVPGVGEAEMLAERTGADLVVWGMVDVGVLDQEVLSPMIYYQPTGPYAPNGWSDFQLRLAEPQVYELSSRPLNGRAVLLPLFQALMRYGRGDVDTALEQIDMLLAQQPSLRPALPRLLRGNLFWARGDYAAAATEYRLALADAAYQPGRIANNLGAALQAAGDAVASAEVLSQAVTLLQAQNDGQQDLGQLRVNAALAWLQGRRFAQAVRELEQGRNLLPPSTELHLLMARAYRENGQFVSAQNQLTLADPQLEVDLTTIPAVYSRHVRQRLEGSLAAERARLQLSVLINGRGPLEWDLNLSPQLASQQVQPLRDQMQSAVTATAQSLDAWRTQSVSDDASGREIAALIATAQARQAEAEWQAQRLTLALIDLELGRARLGRSGNWLGDIWSSLFGEGSPLQRAQRSLEELIAEDEQNVDALFGLARLLRLQGRPDAATDLANRIVQIAPDAPEGYYAQATAALAAAQPDRERARQLFAEAIARAENFYPARLALADLELADQRFDAAIEQLTWLDNYWTELKQPSVRVRLDLARAWRGKGVEFYPQAEMVLIPLANNNNTQALVELGLLYNMAGDTAGASEAFRRALVLNSGLATANFELAQIFENQGQFVEAEALYRATVQSNPGNVSAHLALARLYSVPNLIEGRDASDAAAEYRAAIDAGSTDPAVLQSLGDQLLTLGEARAAADAYQRVAQVRSDDAFVFNLLSKARLEAGQLEQAAAAATRAIELRGGVYPEALVNLAEVDRRSGRYTEAIARYNEVLLQNNALAEAYVGLGRAQADQGNWDQALIQFDTAVARDPLEPLGHFWRAEALLRSSQLFEARDAYRQALSLIETGSNEEAVAPQQTLPEAYLGLAHVYIALDPPDYDQAAQALTNALQWRPNYAEAYLLQGKLYELRGLDDESVLEAYTRAIQLNPRLPEPYYRRALLHVRNQRYGDAERDLNDALRLQTNFAEAHFWLGRVYYARGRMAAARREFQAALDQRAGTYPEARYHLGLTEERLGLLSEAAESFRLAIESDPDAPWVADARNAQQRVQR